MDNLASNDAQVRYPQQEDLGNDTDKQNQINQDTAFESNNAAPRKGAAQEKSSNMDNSQQDIANVAEIRAEIEAAQLELLNNREVMNQIQANAIENTAEQIHERIYQQITDEEFLAVAQERIDARRKDAEKPFVDLDWLRNGLAEIDAGEAKQILDSMRLSNLIHITVVRSVCGNVECVLKNFTRLLSEARFQITPDTAEGSCFRLCASEQGLGVLFAEHIEEPHSVNQPKLPPFAILIDSENFGNRFIPVIEVQTFHMWNIRGVIPPAIRFRRTKSVIFEENGLAPMYINVDRIRRFYSARLD